MYPSRLSNTLPRWDSKLGKHVSDRLRHVVGGQFTNNFLRAYLSKIKSEELEPPALLPDEAMDEEGQSATYNKEKGGTEAAYQPTKGSEFIYLLCLYLQSPHTVQHVLVTDSIITIFNIIQCCLLHLESIKKHISEGLAQRTRIEGQDIPNLESIQKANEVHLHWCFESFHHFNWVVGLSMTTFLSCFRFLSPSPTSALLNLQIREVLFTLFGDIAGDSRSRNRKTVIKATPETRVYDEKLIHSNSVITKKVRDELLQKGLLRLIKGE